MYIRKQSNLDGLLHGCTAFFNRLDRQNNALVPDCRRRSVGPGRDRRRFLEQSMGRRKPGLRLGCIRVRMDMGLYPDRGGHRPAGRHRQFRLAVNSGALSDAKKIQPQT